MERTREVRGSISEDDGGGAGSSSHRSKPAAQACETCRNRKVRCDEERPRCGVCRRLDTTCEYREPKPTKKDKTLLYVLETLKAIDQKVDLLLKGDRDGQGQNATATLARSLMPWPQIARVEASIGRTNFDNILDDSYSSMSPAATTTTTNTTTTRSTYETSSASTSISSGAHSSQRSRGKPGGTPLQSSGVVVEARRVLNWPAIKHLLETEGIPQDLINSQTGRAESWLTRMSNEFSGGELPSRQPVCFFNNGRAPGHAWQSGTIVLTNAIIEEHIRVYFSSFHCLYPFLDQDYFTEVTVAEAAKCKFDETDSGSTLLLLVVALGYVAKEGVSGEAVVDHDTGYVTGVRGGDTQHAPGLALVHEAKRRMGLTLSRYDHTMLICYVLLALYYAQISRNMEFWHMTEMACTICQSLVKTVDNWATFEGDMIARSYWMCTLMEGGLTTELGLGSTGITQLENEVPLPVWITWNGQLPEARPNESLIRYYFLAQITLRSHINRINDSVQVFPSPVSSNGSNTVYNPPRQVILELARAVSLWRQHLPPLLHWSDDLPTSPGPSPAFISTSLRAWYPPFDGVGRVSPSFKNIDVILDASLRSRYRYAQYLIWRPYIYKCLHFPAQSTEEDARAALHAIRASTLWPLTHPVFSDQRRILPHLYEYSHTMFGILMMFVAAARNPILAPYLQGHEISGPAKAYMEGEDWSSIGLEAGGPGPRMKVNEDEQPGATGNDGTSELAAQVAISKDCFLGWLKDMRVVHPVARWSWVVLSLLYGL